MPRALLGGVRVGTAPRLLQQAWRCPHRQAPSSDRRVRAPPWVRPWPAGAWRGCARRRDRPARGPAPGAEAFPLRPVHRAGRTSTARFSSGLLASCSGAMATARRRWRSASSKRCSSPRATARFTRASWESGRCATAIRPAAKASSKRRSAISRLGQIQVGADGVRIGVGDVLEEHRLVAVDAGLPPSQCSKQQHQGDAAGGCGLAPQAGQSPCGHRAGADGNRHRADASQVLVAIRHEGEQHVGVVDEAERRRQRDDEEQRPGKPGLARCGGAAATAPRPRQAQRRGAATQGGRRLERPSAGR